MKPTANGTWAVERDGDNFWIEVLRIDNLLTFQSSVTKEELEANPSIHEDKLRFMIERETKTGRLDGYEWLEDRNRDTNSKYKIKQRVYVRKQDRIIHG